MRFLNFQLRWTLPFVPRLAPSAIQRPAIQKPTVPARPMDPTTTRAPVSEAVGAALLTPEMAARNRERLQEVEVSLRSPVGLDLLLTAVRLGCGHAFNRDEIAALQARVCPNCRARILRSNADESLRNASAAFAGCFPDGAEEADDVIASTYLDAIESAKMPAQFAEPEQQPTSSLEHVSFAGETAHLHIQGRMEQLAAAVAHLGAAASPMLRWASVRDPDVGVRRTARDYLEHLRLHYDRAACMAREPRDRAVRRYGMQALSEHAHTPEQKREAQQIIQDWLGSADVRDCQVALTTWLRIAGTSARAAILHLTAHPRAETRQAARMVLGRLSV